MNKIRYASDTASSITARHRRIGLVFTLAAGVLMGMTAATSRASEGTLALEAAESCLGDIGDIIDVELWMRDLTGNATGFQAFLAFDDAILTYRGDLSSYTDGPFPLHIQDMATAQIAPGQLNLDGSTLLGNPPDPGTSEDSLLATLKFEVSAGCEPTSVTFRDALPFVSELSYHGIPFVTLLINTPSVLDDTPPELTCPTPMWVECLEDVPPPDPSLVTATDNCDPDPTVTHEGDAYYGGPGCPPASPLYILRTYRASDACGNYAECEQVITVIDLTSPTITCPANESVECAGDVPPPDPGLVSAADNCDPNPVVTHVGDTDNGGAGCLGDPLIITRTYRATDACGNLADCTQTFTIVDETSPTITCPDTGWVECVAALPPPEFDLVTVTDNCDPSPTVTHEGDAYSGGIGCIGESARIIRTYRVTDACGNFAECTQGFKIFDLTSPVITCPADVTVECLGDVPPADPVLVTASDNCDPDPLVTHVGDTDNGGSGCPGDPLIVTRTYRATDYCENTAECSQTITVVDTAGPIITCPADLTVESFDPDDPSLGSASAVDNCDQAPSLTYSDSVVEGPCPQASVVIRLWIATDVCSNSSSCEQIITVLDSTPPPPTVLDEEHQGFGDKGSVYRPVDNNEDDATFLLTARSHLDYTAPYDPDAGGEAGNVFVDVDGTGVRTSTGEGSNAISGTGDDENEELIITFDAAIPAGSITLGFIMIDFGSGAGDLDDPVLFFAPVGSGSFSYTVHEAEIEAAFTWTGSGEGFVDFSMLPSLPPGLLIDAFKIRETHDHIEVSAVTMTVSEDCPPPDCNGNGIDDAIDIETGTSLDCNENGTPDECEYEDGCPGIMLADMNCDSLLDGRDIEGFVSYVVAGRYTCQADMDQDGIVDLSDVPLFVGALLAAP